MHVLQLSVLSQVFAVKLAHVLEPKTENHSFNKHYLETFRSVVGHDAFAIYFGSLVVLALLVHDGSGVGQYAGNEVFGR